jgi:hypothetical protein
MVSVVKPKNRWRDGFIRTPIFALANHLIRPREHVRRNRLTILDFGFSILRLRSVQALDCAVTGSPDPL